MEPCFQKISLAAGEWGGSALKAGGSGTSCIASAQTGGKEDLNGGGGVGNGRREV